jgi:hypothetical protein
MRSNYYRRIGRLVCFGRDFGCVRPKRPDVPGITAAQENGIPSHPCSIAPGLGVSNVTIYSLRSRLFPMICIDRQHCTNLTMRAVCNAMVNQLASP